jgi:hypothetical protein
MPIPSKEQDWVYKLNNNVSKPTGATANVLFKAYNARAIVAIVEQLLASGDHAWTYLGSSNGSSYNYDPVSPGTNLWTSVQADTLSFGAVIPGRINENVSPQTGTAAPSAGNWIVLKKTNFFAANVHAYLVLQLGATAAAGTFACSVFVSKVLPSTNNVTATVRPVSPSNELTFRSDMIGAPSTTVTYPVPAFTTATVGTVPAAALWANTGTGATQQLVYAPPRMVVHVMRHAQGFRAVVCAWGIPVFFGMVEFVDGLSLPEGSEVTVGDYTEDLVTAVAVAWHSEWTTAIRPTTGTIPTTLANYWRARRVRMIRNTATAAAPFECYLSQECVGPVANVATATSSETTLSTANALSEEYPLLPVGLVSLCTGAHGRHGYIKDLYWGSEQFVAQPGINYPADGTRAWVQFGSLVFPWDLNEPVTLG